MRELPRPQKCSGTVLKVLARAVRFEGASTIYLTPSSEPICPSEIYFAWKKHFGPQ